MKMKFEQYLIESEIDDLKKELKDSDDYLKAPNGEKSNLPEKLWLMVRTKAFKKWFGDWEKTPNKASKMVDENGEPQVLYHGTGVDAFDDFKEHSYFTNSLKVATEYSKQHPKNGTTSNSIYKVFLNCRKPKLIQKTVHSDRVALFSKTKTVDCLYNDITYVGNSGVYEYVVRNGSQVKSIDNKGDFAHISNMYESINEDVSKSEDLTQTPEFKKWFGKSKCVDKHGKPQIMYHGTPNANFTEFKQYSHFTSDKKYADQYQHASASGGSNKKVKGDAKTIAVYLSIQNPFDTRKPEHKKVFEKEFYRQWGTGAPLSDRGLPDWNDVNDLIDWIEEEDKPYDGVIVDEGGSPDHGHFGFSWVPLHKNQIKSVDNNGKFSNSNNINEATNHTTSAEFKKWFGDSEVVDDSGKPLIVYHGTREEFDEFAPNKEGIHFGSGGQAKMRSGKKIIEAYLSIQKMKRLKDTNGTWTKAVKSAKSSGYDGIVYLNRFEGIPYERFESLRKNGISDEKMDKMSDAQFKKLVPEAQDSYIVFDPSQIKAVKNNGEFSTKTNNIFEQYDMVKK